MQHQGSGGPDLAAMRQNYTLAGLAEDDMAPDWLTQFRRWLDDAVVAQLTEPNAMVVATAAEDGTPAARTVLCKGVDERGVVFYTNLTSAKSHDLDENPRAAVTFPWYPLQRQIHLRGPVSRVDREATLAYWSTRPRPSQLGAWASPQSTVVHDRAELDRMQDLVAARFTQDGRELDVELPPHWGGWRVQPITVEFWQGRTGRMHDRLRYRRDEDGWHLERLAP